jgi:hypothetical protein
VTAKSLTEEELMDAVAEIQALDLLYKFNPALFLKEQARTIDEASGAIRPWWDEQIIDELVHALDTEPLLLLPKSRRRFVSWTVCGYMVHDARYRPYHFNLIQTLNVEKAAFLVGKRCKVIEDNLRSQVLRRKYRHWCGSSGDAVRMEYEETQSTIRGVKEGGDAVRTYTASMIFLDESEFQPHAHDAMTAMKPLLEKTEGKNVKVVLASSSNGPGGPVAGLCREVGFVKFR